MSEDSQRKRRSLVSALMPGSSVGALSRAKSVSDCTIAFIAGTAPGTTADVVLHR